ncbi:aminotransferase class IV family protein [Rhizobium halophytocola]|uniref:Probable branched-chain-amino-acid aminotransferase n=1 Tax=Rhizobium halophytocola TaxID=735519 RepID=A0ABS4DTA4_9HYPH|nr:aminotransferase class IV family protein [Rhizobium halophytocola]MBP1848913.1 4-amino-4-deoxychorismate lyase [Rhizobium halophytocola]
MSSKGAVRARKPAALELIETLRWEPGIGFLRLEHHLRRLGRSADALGFRAPEKAEKALTDAVGGETPLRVRLTLNHRGEVEVATTPFEPVSDNTVWRLRIAVQRVQSDDSFLRHKTSRRDVYDAARAEYSADEADEVLLMNERGELCEGTITSLFAESPDGGMITPALSCGLLPGVLRAELIRERRARNGVLRPQDIVDRTIYVGNSLRGLIRAQLQESDS